MCTAFAAQKRIRNFRYEYCNKPGLHIGRHRGARLAQSDILVYADDDIRPFKTWLHGIACGFRDERIVMVGGNNLPDFESEAPTWVQQMWAENEHGRTCGCFSLIDCGEKVKKIPPDMVYGCNFSIRKLALIKAFGFHPDGMPKDLICYRGDGETAVSQAILRMGFNALFHPDASIYHWVPQRRMTQDYLFERGYAQGISASYSKIRASKGANCGLLSDRRLILAVKKSLRKVFYNGRCFLGLRPISKAQQWFVKGHETGFAFHQQAAIRSSSLLDWICQADYWDESLSPSLTASVHS
jgi:glycosyltransferase involved in cell wall biosynthesis